MRLAGIIALSARIIVAQYTSLYYCADAGSTDSYACSITPPPIPFAYQTGFHYRFKANTANTGTASINFNSLGAITIVIAAGGITTTLSDNAIRAGQMVDLIYDGTNMQMQSTSGIVPPTVTGGSCTNQVVTAISNSVVPTCSSFLPPVLWGNLQAATLTANQTGRRFFFNSGFSTSTTNTAVISPFTGTLKGLYITTLSTQGNANTVCTVIANGSSTSIVVTIAANAVAGVFADSSDTAPITAGQTIAVSCDNGNAVSAQFQAYSLGITP